MASLRLLLGLIPSTIKFEQQEKALAEEYEKLKAFIKSEELAKYNELKPLINAAGFKQKKREVESLKYKGSPEFIKEKEYKKLARSKEINLYLKTVDSPDLRKYQILEGSDMVKRFEELDKLVKTPAFLEKKRLKKSVFMETEEYNLLEEYNKLQSSSDLKEYYRYGKSKELKNYLKVHDSHLLKRYNDLKEYIGSAEFAERKEYLLDKKRFEKTEMFAQLAEYEALKKSDDIIWYFKVKDSNKFDRLKKLELTFNEEFDSGTIDEKRWLTSYYWGEKLLNDRYSVEDDLHLHTEKENFDIRNSVLAITTRQKKGEGKAWSAAKGFTTKEFEFTSGLINSGNSFRQKYGVFTAKIKLDNASARNGFWLLGDKITPHIDICRTGKGKIWCDIFRDEKSVAKKNIPGKYVKDFYIYTLEWTPGKMVWKLNGEIAFTQTANIPDEPMYITLAGGVDGKTPVTSNMEIDWIRAYNYKE